MKYLSVTTITLFVLMICSRIVAQEATPSEFPTRTPYDTSAFPSNLYCEQVETPGSGPTWGEVTIGDTNIEELAAYVNVVGDYQMARYSDFVSFFRFGSDVIYPLIEACLDTETQKVTALKISMDGLLNIEDLIALYGEPDVVTWGTSNISRTVFWFNEGISASVYVLEESDTLNYGEIGLIVYFPYQTVEDFEERWPYNRTNSENPTGGDRIYEPPPSEAQNPFNFVDIIATITAEPSRTPTPTFAPPSATPTIAATATP